MYNVKYTDLNKTPIEVQEGEVNSTSTDLDLFGRVKLEYGQELNENMLHLLENFSAPEITGSTFIAANPDFNNATYRRILSKPVGGQLWYNTTRDKFYFWNGTIWFPITQRGEYAANWGVIADGYSLPQPVNPTTGYVFPYSECIWSVAPASFNGRFDYTVCATDNNAVVTSKFRYVGQTTLVSSVANYLIIGIRSNNNLGTNVSPPIPTPTPTPSVGTSNPITPTPTNSATLPPGATPTPTVTRTPGGTPAPSVTPSTTRSVGATPPVTPTRTPTRTPTTSLSHTPPVTVTPTPMPTPTASASPIAPMIATFTNGISGMPTTGQPLGILSSYCRRSLHATPGDIGVNCSGAVVSCSANQCAPEPGDDSLGAELKVTVSGGIAPYTVRFTNWSGSFSTGNQCVVLTIGSPASNLVVPTNSAGNIVAPNTTLTATRTISSSGGNITGIAVAGKCSGLDLYGSGTLQIIITDSSPIPKTITKEMSWNLSWITDL